MIFLPRMKPAVSFLEVIDRQSDILLGGRELGVAEHLLDMADPGVVPYERSSACVPKRVRRDVLVKPGLPRVLGDEFGKRVPAQPAGPRAREQRRGERVRAVFEQFRPDPAEIALKVAAGNLPHRHYPVLAALALPDHYQPCFHVHVLQVQVEKLLPPDAGGVEQFHNGPVPEAKYRGYVRLP